jgi:hypothetical protein
MTLHSWVMRRVSGVLFVIGAVLWTAWLHYDATDFPSEDPVQVVDAELVEHLRANPGLHLALSPQHRFEVELVLHDDPLNRLVYGTSVDLREQRDDRAIHVQFKGARGAIHTDGHNPKAGVLGWLIHATVDVPFTPLPVLALLGVWLVSGRRLRAPGRAGPGDSPTDPAAPLP